MAKSVDKAKKNSTDSQIPEQISMFLDSDSNELLLNEKNNSTEKVKVEKPKETKPKAVKPKAEKPKAAKPKAAKPKKDVKSKKATGLEISVMESLGLSKKPAGDKTSLFYGKVCVVVGKFENYERQEVLQKLYLAGAYLRDSVTGSAEFLIVGDADISKTAVRTKATSLKKVKEQQEKGKEIHVITETMFQCMTGEKTFDYCEAISTMIEEITLREELLPGTIQFIHKKENKTDKDYALRFFEQRYPALPGNPEAGTIRPIVTIKEETSGSYKGCIKIGMSKIQYEDVPCPASAVSVTGSRDGSKTVRFKAVDPAMMDYIKAQILFEYNLYVSNANFGCCSRFKECSDAKRCVHPNKLYATGCMYGVNLKKGNIFYGENQTIDVAAEA